MLKVASFTVLAAVASLTFGCSAGAAASSTDDEALHSHRDASTSDAGGGDASNGGSSDPGTTHATGNANDPFDDASCAGSIDDSALLKRIKPGSTSAAIGSYRFYVQARTCNSQTGCGDWSDSTLDEITPMISIYDTPSGGYVDPDVGDVKLEVGDNGGSPKFELINEWCQVYPNRSQITCTAGDTGSGYFSRGGSCPARVGGECDDYGWMRNGADKPQPTFLSQAINAGRLKVASVTSSCARFTAASSGRADSQGTYKNVRIALLLKY